MKEMIKDMAIAIVVALIVVQFVRPTIVNGPSMESTLQDRDYLLLSRQAYHSEQPEYGDIVVVQCDALDEKIIKRVIGLPGDEIKVEDNKVYRNGELLKETYIKEQGVVPGEVDITVPEEEVFVMGDNRGNSMDSRVLGCLRQSDIYGKAFFRVFPFKEWGKLS